MTLVRYIFSYIIYIILILVKNLNMETIINPNDLEKYWIERQKINQSYIEKRQNLLKQLGELEVEHQTSITKLDDKFGKTIKSWINAKQNMMKFLDDYEKEKRYQFEVKNNEAKENDRPSDAHRQRRGQDRGAGRREGRGDRQPR